MGLKLLRVVREQGFQPGQLPIQVAGGRLIRLEEAGVAGDHIAALAGLRILQQRKDPLDLGARLVGCGLRAPHLGRRAEFAQQFPR